MGRYVARRLLQAVLVLLAAYTVSFLVLNALPGDPVSAMAGAGSDSASIDPQRINDLKHAYGFDKPLVLQYLTSLGRALHGDFGISVSLGQSVVRVIATALPPTLALTGAALLLSVVFGAGLAILATYTPWRWGRQVLLSLPPLGVCVPTFWIGLSLVQLFSFRIHIFAAFGNDGLAGLVLPAVTLAIPTGAQIAQVLAKSLLTALDEPYIETARAKGAGRARIHFRHALRNAALPALTVTGLRAGQILGESVVVETVFARNGLGRITQGAVNAQDLPLVQGIVVFGAVVFVLINLLIDLVYPVFDPRVATAPRLKAAVA